RLPQRALLMTKPIGNAGHKVFFRGRSLFRDQSGVGAIEFAILLPILLALYVGAVELCDALTAKRKVTSATSAVGDLVTRTKELSGTDMSEILSGAAGRVLYPYPVDGGNIQIKVTCASIDSNKAATVKWSDQLNATKDVVGATIALPDGV